MSPWTVFLVAFIALISVFFAAEVVSLCAAIWLEALSTMVSVRGDKPSTHGASIGCHGHVTTTIPAKGWGGVTYTDYDGHLIINRLAISAHGVALGNGTHVYVDNVDGETLLVAELPPI